MVCRDFILPEGCKPCLLLSSFQFCETYSTLSVEPENPLRTAEMTPEDDYGMIDGIINNGRRGEELEKAQAEARRTTTEKKPSIRERLEDAKRECGSRKGPDKPAPQKKPSELGDL